MKSLEIQPTPENIRQTYLEDSIGRTASVNDFVSILNTIEGHYSIALEGNWGSGKTFFINQVKMVLDSFNYFSKLKNKEEIKNKFIESLDTNEHNLELYKTVYFDAWSNDNDNDPLLSLIYSIIQSESIKFEDNHKADITKILTTIIDAFSPIKTTDLLNAYENKDNNKDIFEEIKQANQLKNNVNKFFNDILSEQGNKLIIFVDELDRCKPTYAIKLLERIKHYFDNDKIVFVFSINSNELQHTIKKCYGNDFNATKYLDRFFDFKIPLPKVNKDKYAIDFDLNSNFVYDRCSILFIKTYNLELREIAKYAQQLKLVKERFGLKTSPDTYVIKPYFVGSYTKDNYILSHYFIPIIIGLKFVDNDLYEKFINGENAQPLTDVLNSDNDFQERFYSRTNSSPETVYNQIYNDDDGQFWHILEHLQKITNFLKTN